MEAFWQHGYGGCSLPQLLAATGLSRSSLYQAFGGKAALFERCVDLYTERMVAAMTEALAAAPTALSYIEARLRAVAAEPRGCLLVNLAAEFGQSDRVLAEGLTRSFARIETVFQRAVTRGQQEGEIAPGLDGLQTARYLIATTSGLRTLVRSGASRQVIDQTVDLALRALR